MQIHEITKKQLNEAGGLAATFGGIKSIAQQGVNQALGTNFGGAQAGATVAPGIGAQTASVKLAQTLVPDMAAQQSKLWTQGLQAMMANQQVQSLKQLDQAELLAAANAQISKALDTTDWHTFVNQIDPKAFGGAGAQAAAKVKSYMDQSIKNLIANTAKKDIPDKYLEGANTNIWKQIASMIVQVQNMRNFNKAQGATSGSASVGTPQQAAAVLNRAGVNGAALTGLQSVLNSLGPIPTGTLTNTQRSILKAMGAQVK